MDTEHWKTSAICSMFLPFFALLLSLGLGSKAAQAAGIIYAASGSHGVNGTLYTLNPSTGAATAVGPLVDASAHPYGLTGLAFDPGSGKLYGATSEDSSTSFGHLVLVNPTTAQVTDIGTFGPAGMSDIKFDRTTGILYGVHAFSDHWLYTINTSTGAATKVGSGTRGDFGGGGLAVTAAGVMYVTPDGSTATNPTLRTIDKATGNETVVALLSGFSLPGAHPRVIDAMDFDSSGVLLGIQTTDGGTNPTTTHLVTINPSTGVITDVGLSAGNLDALAVQGSATSPVPIPTTWLLVITGMACIALYQFRAKLFPRRS